MGLIAQLRKAWFRTVGDNEITLDGDPSFRDPVKFRGGSYTEETLLAISGDRLEGDTSDPIHRAKAQISLKAEGEFGLDGGAIDVHLQRPGTTEDGDTIRVFRLTTQYAEFGVPIRGATIPAPSTTGDRFYSANRQYCWNFQGDGHEVQYDTHQNIDESKWEPVWSSWFGIIRPLPWPKT